MPAIQFPARPRIQRLRFPSPPECVLFDNDASDILARGGRIVEPCFLVILRHREVFPAEAAGGEEHALAEFSGERRLEPRLRGLDFMLGMKTGWVGGVGDAVICRRL